MTGYFKSQTFWSVMLIFVGVSLLGINLGVVSSQLIKFWPMIFIVLGLVGLSETLDKKR